MLGMIDQLLLASKSSRGSGGKVAQERMETFLEEIRKLLGDQNIEVCVVQDKYHVSYTTAKRWLDILVSRNMAIMWKVGQKRWYGASAATLASRKSRKPRGY